MGEGVSIAQPPCAIVVRCRGRRTTSRERFAHPPLSPDAGLVAQLDGVRALLKRLIVC